VWLAFTFQSPKLLVVPAYVKYTFVPSDAMSLAVSAGKPVTDVHVGDAAKGLEE
jgi:hypothetical protein